MYSFGLYPLIIKPSRISDVSATLINNIFTNEAVNDISSGVLVTDISDHLPVFALCNYIDIDRPKEKCFKYTHDTQVQRIEAFGAALSVQDWGHHETE